MQLSRRNVVISVLLSLFWVTLLACLRIYPATFRPDLKDHISNINSGIIFWHRGMDVYTKSLAEISDGPVEASPDLLKKFQWEKEEVVQLNERAGKDPLLIVWPNIPRPYPPGLWVVLGPFSFVTDVLGKFLPVTVFGLVFLTLICAHFCVFILWNSVRPYVGRASSVLILCVLYNEVVGWSLCSQIDAIALLIFIWSFFAFKNRDFWSYFSRFTLTSLVQFRVLFFLPLMLVKAKEKPFKEMLASLRNRTAKDKLAIVASLAGLILSIYVFLLIIESVRHQSSFNNNLHYSKWFEGLGSHQALFLVLLVLVCGWLWQVKDFLMLVVCLWWAVFFSTMPFVRGWYVLFLLPVLLLNENKPWRGIAVYSIFATMFFSSFPLDFWMPRMVFNYLVSVMS